MPDLPHPDSVEAALLRLRGALRGLGRAVMASPYGRMLEWLANKVGRSFH